MTESPKPSPADAIVAVVQELLESGGYEAVHLREVARRASATGRLDELQAFGLATGLRLSELCALQFGSGSSGPETPGSKDTRSTSTGTTSQWRPACPS